MVADQLLTIKIDTAALAADLGRVGDRALLNCMGAARRTADDVKALAQSNIHKRRPFTFKNIAIESRQVAHGYAVMMDRHVKDVPSVSGRRALHAANARQVQRLLKQAERQARHVGKWLEFGTVHQAPKPWLFPAGAAFESVYLERIARAIEQTVQEAGF